MTAILYVAFSTFRLARRQVAPGKLLKVIVLLSVVLGVAHAGTVSAYSGIPQWDFQDTLFDDLSWPGPGKISQVCQQQPSASLGQSISYEEVLRIAQIDDWQVRKREFSGKATGAWRGWITELSNHGYYSNPDHRLVVVTMDNPYVPGTGSDRKLLSQAVLSYFSPADIAQLSVGQEVLVCGAISDAELDSSGRYWISISRPVLNPLPMPEALASTQIPPDFLLEYEQHGCGEGYPCNDYTIRIEANGVATYDGRENVTVTGTHTTQVSVDKLSALVFELRRTEFLNIEGVPDRIEGNLEGAAILRVRMDGKSKTLAFPWMSGPWPRAMIMITGKIEEVTNLRQWVKLVRSP